MPCTLMRSPTDWPLQELIVYRTVVCTQLNAGIKIDIPVGYLYTRRLLQELHVG